jgi:hypothetical protein
MSGTLESQRENCVRMLTDLLKKGLASRNCSCNHISSVIVLCALIVQSRTTFSRKPTKKAKTSFLRLKTRFSCATRKSTTETAFRAEWYGAALLCSAFESMSCGSGQVTWNLRDTHFANTLDQLVRHHQRKQLQKLSGQPHATHSRIQSCLYRRSVLCCVCCDGGWWLSERSSAPPKGMSASASGVAPMDTGATAAAAAAAAATGPAAGSTASAAATAPPPTATAQYQQKMKDGKPFTRAIVWAHNSHLGTAAK